MFIPDPNFSIPDTGSRVKKIPDPGSGSALKDLKFLTPEIVLSSRKYDTGCSFRTLDPGLHFTHPGSGSATLVAGIAYAS
jgi:hypothetical protein